MIKKQEQHTVYETLSEGKDILKNANIDTFDLDSRVLLSYILGMEHHLFISNPKAIVPPKQYKEYLKLIKRRAKNEPIAQITNQKEFWALPFKITKHTLIPRPDSETLIEGVKSEFKDVNAHHKIIDLGTGSGCLLLAILSEYKNATGVGIDISQNAVKTANQNAKKLSLDNRTQILKYSWENKSPHKKIKDIKFNIVVSNPPYITKNDMKKLDIDVKKYEPHNALYGGNDGLSEYRYIAKSLYYWDIIEPKGKIFLEMGKGQENDIKKIFEAFGFKFLHYFKDLNGIIRVIELQKE
ncbi:MAG: peptide chain release factor N(5)-glutamine methyltransferase [Alphaproteobacteria bacterium]